MEGLPFDFGEEDDSDEQGSKKESRKRKDRKAAKDLVSLIRLENKPEAKDQKTENQSEVAEKNEKGETLGSDKTPELDAEAPVEHLSRVEVEAINQTLASERLRELHNVTSDEVSPEAVAIENFLENVEASGDVDQAFNEAATELGVEPGDDIEAVIPLADEELTTSIVNPSEFYEDVAVSARGSSPSSTIIRPLAPVNNFESSTGTTTREASAGGLLVGGIVSYLIGRRQGRIIAEEKLIPVQKRLESEVHILQANLQSREHLVSSMAIAKGNQSETITSGLNGAEVSKPLYQERIGHVLMGAELPKTTERQPNSNKEEAPELTTIRAQTMNRAELLLVAQKISIDGTSLRQIYESHLVGEKGLRRIIAVHLRGGNIKRTLKRELVEREIDFERDPNLRDQDSTKPISAVQSNLDNLLQKSGIDWSEPQPIIRSQNKAQDNLGQLAIRKPKRSSSVRRIADILLVGVIMILATVIIALILNK